MENDVGFVKIVAELSACQKTEHASSEQPLNSGF